MGLWKDDWETQKWKIYSKTFYLYIIETLLLKICSKMSETWIADFFFRNIPVPQNNKPKHVGPQLGGISGWRSRISRISRGRDFSNPHLLQWMSISGLMGPPNQDQLCGRSCLSGQDWDLSMACFKGKPSETRNSMRFYSQRWKPGETGLPGPSSSTISFWWISTPIL